MIGSYTNSDQNVTGVTDEELARANKISQESDDCQEITLENDSDTEEKDEDNDEESRNPRDDEHIDKNNGDEENKSDT